VNRLAQNIARNSDLKVPVTAKVIDNKEVNAFALPGGFVFVHTGLLEKARTEAEVAGVLAHELAHVAARHGTRQASRGQIANWASIPLIFMGGWGGYAAQQAAGLAVPLTFLKYSRDFEKEADMLGLQYMYAAGYDPTAFIDFFERLQAEEKKKPGTLSKVFRSHPPTEDRIKEAQKNIAEILPAKPEYVVTSSEFSGVKEHLGDLLSARREDKQDPNRPTLRKRPDGEVRTDGGKPGRKADDVEPDERPTLKRQS
jgi:predicted Zn-dependent protease